jgi:flagellar basal-body rod protein FlgB
MSSFEMQPIFALLSRALDVASLRQAVHTANIANADVDGYRRLEVAADTALNSAAMDVSGIDPAAIAADPQSIAMPRVVIAADQTVKLDQEMALMAKDAVRYQALLGAVDRTIGLLRSAINEGKGV